MSYTGKTGTRAGPAHARLDHRPRRRRPRCARDGRDPVRARRAGRWQSGGVPRTIHAAFNKPGRSRAHGASATRCLEWQALPWRPVISITPSVCLMKRPQCFAMPGLDFFNLPLYIRANLALRRGKADEAVALIREASAAVARFTTNSHSSSRSLRWPPPPEGDDTWAAMLGTWDAVTERKRLRSRQDGA